MDEFEVAGFQGEWSDRVGISEPVFVILAFLMVQYSVLALLGGVHSIDAATSSLVSSLASALAAIVAGTWIAKSKPMRRGIAQYGLIRASRPAIAWSAVSGTVLSVVVLGLIIAFPYTGPANPLLADAFFGKGTAVLIGWITVVVVVGPIGEEMVFRGAVFAWLVEKSGSPVGAVVAAILFTLVHVPQLGGYWPAIVAILTLGIVAGIARIRTGSLLAPIVLHVSYNAMTMALLLSRRW